MSASYQSDQLVASFVGTNWFGITLSSGVDGICFLIPWMLSNPFPTRPATNTNLVLWSLKLCKSLKLILSICLSVCLYFTHFNQTSLLLLVKNYIVEVIWNSKMKHCHYCDNYPDWRPHLCYFEKLLAYIFFHFHWVKRSMNAKQHFSLYRQGEH